MTRNKNRTAANMPLSYQAGVIRRQTLNMKTISVLTILVLLHINVCAQQYHKMIRKNVFWDEATYLSVAPCYTSIGRMEFIDGDTLIDGHYYRFSNGYPFIGTPGPDGTLCPPYYVDTIPYKSAFLREDTIAKKVFIYDEFSNSHDQLLYDFSLLPGDTLDSEFHMNTFVLDTIIDTILLNGDIRKMFCFDPQCNIYYIESIGGWQGLTFPIGIGLGFGGDLLCVNENNEDLWGYNCGYYFVGLENNTNHALSVYPNPTSGIIEIKVETGLMPAATFLLYNSLGQIILSAELITNSSKLNLSNLKPGGYYYSIVSSNYCKKGKLIMGQD